jgi:hypothetical protein
MWVGLIQFRFDAGTGQSARAGRVELQWGWHPPLQGRIPSGARCRLQRGQWREQPPYPCPCPCKVRPYWPPPHQHHRRTSSWGPRRRTTRIPSTWKTATAEQLNWSPVWKWIRRYTKHLIVIKQGVTNVPHGLSHRVCLYMRDVYQEEVPYVYQIVFQFTSF